jgi:hypothetical protein
VIELDDETGDPGHLQLPWLYVGQSVKPPEERFEQHLAGVRASRWVKKHAVRLRPDLYEDQPILRTQAEALTYERWLFEWLLATGRAVRGGT